MQKDRYDVALWTMIFKEVRNYLSMQKETFFLLLLFLWALWVIWFIVRCVADSVDWFWTMVREWICYCFPQNYFLKNNNGFILLCEWHYREGSDW